MAIGINLQEAIAAAMTGRVVTLTPPGALFVALSSTNPATALTEPSAYTRQPFTLSLPVTSQVDGTLFSNDNALVFPTVSAGTYTHVAILDASSRVYFSGAIAAPRTVIAGDSISFAANTLRILLDGIFTQVASEAIVNFCRGTPFPNLAITQVGFSTTLVTRDATNIVKPPAVDNYSDQSILFSVPAVVLGKYRFANTNAAIFGPAANQAWPVLRSVVFYNSTNVAIASAPLSSAFIVNGNEGVGIGVSLADFIIQ